MHQEEVEGHKGLVAKAERSVATGQAAMANASTRRAAAKDRIDRLCKGEDVAGGLATPKTVEQLLAELGWTKADLRKAECLNEIHALGAWEELMDGILRSHERAERAVARAVLRRHVRREGD